MRNLGSVQRMLEEFYKIDPTIDINSIGAFLLVAAAGPSGLRQSEIVKKMNRPKGTISRFVSKIGNGPVSKGKPYYLTCERSDPSDGRGKIITLNEKGQQLREVLVAALQGPTPR